MVLVYLDEDLAAEPLVEVVLVVAAEAAVVQT
jgi:hypothetical protein